MAYVCIIIQNNDTIGNINAKCQNATNPHEAIELCRNYLDAIMGGNKPSTVQVTSRDTDPGVTTSGTDSEQETYNLA